MAIAIYIEYEALPGCLEALRERLQSECEDCIREDQGCLRMELSQPEPADGRLMLSELWRDRQALEDHKNKPGHSHAWQEALVGNKRVVSGSVVASPVKQPG